MPSLPRLQPIKDLIPISQAAKLLLPKFGKHVCVKSIKRWGAMPGEPDKGTYRVYAANGWKVSTAAFLTFAARTKRLAPRVLVAG